MLLLGAVVYDLWRRRRLGALNKDDISSAMDRARGDADLQLRRGFTGGTGGELAASWQWRKLSHACRRYPRGHPDLFRSVRDPRPRCPLSTSPAVHVRE